MDTRAARHTGHRSPTPPFPAAVVASRSFACIRADRNPPRAEPGRRPPVEATPPRPGRPYSRRMGADQLRAVPLFDGLDDGQLRQLEAAGERVPFEPGDELFVESRPAEDWWVLLEGSVSLVRRVGHEETVQARMDTPGQWAGGFRAWDPTGVYLATGRARVRRLRAAGAGGRAAGAGRGLVPLRRAHHPGPRRYGPPGRVDRPAAGGAGRPRHAGGRLRARDQQPGRGGDPRGRCAAGHRCRAARVVRAPRCALRRSADRAGRAAPGGQAGGGGPAAAGGRRPGGHAVRLAGRARRRSGQRDRASAGRRRGGRGLVRAGGRAARRRPAGGRAGLGRGRAQHVGAAGGGAGVHRPGVRPRRRDADVAGVASRRRPDPRAGRHRLAGPGRRPVRPQRSESGTSGERGPARGGRP